MFIGFKVYALVNDSGYNQFDVIGLIGVVRNDAFKVRGSAVNRIACIANRRILHVV
jgi:hypothetical protein